MPKKNGRSVRLKVENLDFENKTALVWACKREGGDSEFDRVPMTDTLTTALKDWLKERPVESEFVFTNLGEEKFSLVHYGKPFINRQHFLGKLCEKAEVRVFSYHAIRHLSASILYNSGATVSTVQAILRHKSLATTTRYLHSLSLRQAREALDSVMNGRGGEQVALAV